MTYAIIKKVFKTLEGAETYLGNLYEEFDYVRLIQSPLDTEGGMYVFRVGNPKD